MPDLSSSAGGAAGHRPAAEDVLELAHNPAHRALLLLRAVKQLATVSDAYRARIKGEKIHE